LLEDTLEFVMRLRHLLNDAASRDTNRIFTAAVSTVTNEVSSSSSVRIVPSRLFQHFQVY